MTGEPEKTSPDGPSIGQGCLIAVGGAVLGFFGCLGGIQTGSTPILIGSIVVGLVIWTYGTKQAIEGIKRRVRESWKQRN